MARAIQEPTVTHEAGPQGGDVSRHPAFGQLSAGRVEGGTVLYGSDFVHQRYIRIKIAPSEVKRSLSNDWYYAHRPLIEVDVSEAQWATFVSSLNVGQGVPCTIASKDGVSIPGLPRPQDRSEQFGSEVKERLARASNRLADLEAMIAATGLSKAKQAELLDAVRSARQDIVENTKHVTEQFDEHMEKTVEGAKIEVNAYLLGAVQAAGLKALGARPVLELSYETGGDDEQSVVEAAP